MTSSYTLECAGTHTAQSDIVAFFEQFYAASDTPGNHEVYVDNFTPDATLILASNTANGRDEITKTRIAMWDTVVSRKHKVFKLYTFGQEELNVMLYGTVDLKTNRTTAAVDWAARAELEKSADDGKYRMKFYQIYLDTAASSAYKK